MQYEIYCNRHLVKGELAKVRDWALQNAWETTNMIGLENV